MKNKEYKCYEKTDYIHSTFGHLGVELINKTVAKVEPNIFQTANSSKQPHLSATYPSLVSSVITVIETEDDLSK